MEDSASYPASPAPLATEGADKGSLRLTDEDRADIRSGCNPQATHFNDSADVKVDLVVKMLAYIEHLEAQDAAVLPHFAKLQNERYDLELQLDEAKAHTAALTTQLAEARAAVVRVQGERLGFQQKWQASETRFAAAAAESAQLAARLKEEEATTADQARGLLLRDEELRKLRAAIEAASSRRMSADELEAYASNTNGQGTRGAYGAGQLMGRVSLAQDLLALFNSFSAAAPLQGEGEGGQGE